MKFTAPLLTAVCCLPALFLRAQEAAPAGGFEEFTQPPLENFSKIWEVSPFVAVTDLSGQVDDTAGRFVITGFFRAGERDVVLLFDRTTLQRFALSPGDAKDGISLATVKHSGRIDDLRVTLSAGGPPVEIVYDAQAVPTAAANTGGPQPGMPQHAGQPVPQPGVPQMNTPQPGQPPQTQPPPRRVIRRRAIVAPQ